MLQKKDFKNHERVYISALGLGFSKSNEIFYGTVVGKAFEHIIDFYIVRLDNPQALVKSGVAKEIWDCVSVPETILTAADDDFGG